jgi:cobalt/nickel transport system permease protein
MLLHIGACSLNLASQRQKLTPWQTLAPQTRLLCVLLLVFAIVLTPVGHWSTWAVYSVAVLGLIWIGRVPPSFLAQRIAVESAFVGVMVLGTLFRYGSTVLWQWGWLKISTTGLTIFGSVVCKLLLSLTLMKILIFTTPAFVLLQALMTLRCPPLLVAILASMYRYLGLLTAEFTSMQQAALSRNLMGHRRWQRLVVGNLMGSLFIRTYDRGERIHQAMLARGYQGLLPKPERYCPRRRDYLTLMITAMWVLLGQLIQLWVSQGNG